MGAPLLPIPQSLGQDPPSPDLPWILFLDPSFSFTTFSLLILKPIPCRQVEQNKLAIFLIAPALLSDTAT